jgi:hypothetical protein
MYRLREMTMDDKVCEQVSMTMLSEMYPRKVIERCVQQSEPWNSKVRRVRLSTALGSQCLRALMQQRCQVLATPASMPDAFFGRYRLMAIDGTLFHTPDTKANAAAFGRSSNQYGPGAYPQVKCVLLAECGSHAVVGLEMDRYDVSEVHGAYRLLSQVGPDTLVLVDAGLISGAFIEQVRARRAQVLGALEAGAWEHPKTARRLADGSVLAWVAPSHAGRYRQQRGMWVRIISYRVTDARVGEPGKIYRLVTTLLNPRVAPALSLINLYHERWEIELVIDEIKTHERAQRKVLRSKTPEGVRKAPLWHLPGALRRASALGRSGGGGRTRP